MQENGRGVVIYVRDDLQAEVASDNELTRSNFRESVWIDLKGKNHQLLFGCIYRSPNSEDTNTTALIKLIEDLATKGRHFITVGDFNYSSIKWNDIMPRVSRDAIDCSKRL